MNAEPGALRRAHPASTWGRRPYQKRRVPGGSATRRWPSMWYLPSKSPLLVAAGSGDLALVIGSIRIGHGPDSLHNRGCTWTRQSPVGWQLQSLPIAEPAKLLDRPAYVLAVTADAEEVLADDPA